YFQDKKKLFTFSSQPTFHFILKYFSTFFYFPIMTSSSESDEALNVWSKLETNKNFDDRDNSETSNKWLLPRMSKKTTKEINGFSANISSVSRLSFQAAPYSLLVQSLIKQLCQFIETDDSKSKQLYNKICEKLYKMNFIDQSYERSEFENIRMSYELALKQLVEATRGNTLNLKELEIWPLTYDNPQTALEWSRYHRDFQEIAKIGEGGFGDVWKSKHKLDCIEYAVKKIRVKAKSVKNILNHLGEVKTFASLNHVNIVPYKSCWFEPLISYQYDDNAIEAPPSSSSTDESSFAEESNNTRSFLKTDSLRLKSDSFTIEFQHSQEQNFQESSISTVESMSKMEKIRQLKKANGANTPHIKLTWAVLYIQMKLCQKTLRNFLDERNEHEEFHEFYKKLSVSKSDEERNHQLISLGMFHQICNGLEYIHNKGIVHHDIKPSNIFISNEDGDVLTLQLGDFGLACPLENEDKAEVRHNGFGTRLYAAPEQLEGKCCKMSDIYSLGVVLIELLSKCITVMECFKKVEKMRKGENVSDIDLESCDLIKKLLNHRSDRRAKIVELKQIIELRLQSPVNEVDRLRKVIVEKDDELEKKDQQIFQLMNEISELRRQFSCE
ncbi:CLUMA_CG016997, isoform A, partial [Clunio marinus]